VLPGENAKPNSNHFPDGTRPKSIYALILCAGAVAVHVIDTKARKLQDQLRETLTIETIKLSQAITEASGLNAKAILGVMPETLVSSAGHHSAGTEYVRAVPYSYGKAFSPFFNNARDS
jgi:hypothetical protein